MARSLNKVLLIGYIADEPTVHNFSTGSKLARVTLVTNEFSRNGDANGNNEVPEWHHLVFWNNMADTVERYVHKGSRLYAEGRIKTRSYTDKEGMQRYATEIVVSNMIMLDSRRDPGDAPPVAGPYIPLSVEQVGRSDSFTSAQVYNRSGSNYKNNGKPSDNASIPFGNGIPGEVPAQAPYPTFKNPSPYNGSGNNAGTGQFGAVGAAPAPAPYAGSNAAAGQFGSVGAAPAPAAPAPAPYGGRNGASGQFGDQKHITIGAPSAPNVGAMNNAPFGSAGGSYKSPAPAAPGNGFDNNALGGYKPLDASLKGNSAPQGKGGTDDDIPF